MRPHHLVGAHASMGVDAPFEYSLTAHAAHRAARLWFQTATELPAAQFRDQLFREHCQGYNYTPAERNGRQFAFRQAFATAIGHILVEEGRLRAAT